MSSAPRFNAAAFFVDRHLEEGRGGRTVFRFEGHAVSYAELAERVARAGNALAGLGVEIEQRVVLIVNDSPALAAAFWGAVKLGAVVVPVNSLMTPADYAFVLNDSRARVVVVEASVAPRIMAVRDGCPWLREVVTVGAPVPGTLGFDGLLEKAGTSLAPAATSREDIAYWGYTSGSTGPPKAAVHPQKDFLAAADLVGVGVFAIGPDDLVFSASKTYFAFGLGNTLLFPARVGGAAVLVPERVEPERAFEVIARERPTVFFTVPTLYARMLALAETGRFDVSSLRLCVSSGEALPPAIFDAWKARFGHELVDVVGSTENLHDFIANRPGAVRRGSAGQLVPGFEARIVDDAGHPMPDGEVGHLLVKGETTAPYYWNRLEQTRATMLGPWLRTGDMFSRDAEGWFYFAGRSDDMLKVGGQWASPAEIEAALAEHPAVLESGVVGRPDAQGLPRPHASVVLKPGAAVSEAELIAFARERLAHFKAPRSIAFVAELPRTATGKIQRFRLRTSEGEFG